MIPTKEQFEKRLQQGHTIQGGVNTQTFVNMRTSFVNYRGFAYFYYSHYYEHYVVTLPQASGFAMYTTEIVDNAYEDFVTQYTRTKDLEGVVWDL